MSDKTQGESGIRVGFVAKPDEIEKACGRKLDPRIFNLSMTGHRLLVAKDVPETTYKGRIIIPQELQDREKLAGGVGFVVAVGPDVGSGDSPHPRGVVCEHPADLLGKHIIFGMWSGTGLKMEITDHEFDSKEFHILTDRDVFLVDFNPREAEDDSPATE